MRYAVSPEAKSAGEWSWSPSYMLSLRMRGALLPQPQHVFMTWEAFHISSLYLFLLQPKLRILSTVSSGDRIRRGSLPSLRPLVLIKELRWRQTNTVASEPSLLDLWERKYVEITSSRYVPGDCACARYDENGLKALFNIWWFTMWFSQCCSILVIFITN
jgi:hypothetical protein